MIIKHPQESIISTFEHNGATVELVEWQPTVWCGKLGYADNNTDEPDVEKVMNGFMSLDHAAVSEREADWDVCISVNYLSSECPNGVMFGYRITGVAPEGFDIYNVPAAKFMRISLDKKTAAALGKGNWEGGIPPYEWIGEIAPAHGYKYGSDSLPIIEYYGYYDPAANEHKYRYLYVPVEKADA